MVLLLLRLFSLSFFYGPNVVSLLCSFSANYQEFVNDVGYQLNIQYLDFLSLLELQLEM